MIHLTMYNVERGSCGDIYHRKWSPDSAIPLDSEDSFSLFLAHVLVIWPAPFKHKSFDKPTVNYLPIIKTHKLLTGEYNIEQFVFIHICTD